MKIHILFQFKHGPFGGGNQFLRVLKEEFKKMGVYEERKERADAILFNSHHHLKQAFCLKNKFPKKVFIHRIDGPIFNYRKKEKFFDKAIFDINKLLADITVFQSLWCFKENKKYFSYPSDSKIILNAGDPIFNQQGKKPFDQNKIKLIAVSWSSNWLKGFDIYKYLDENLNFSKYEMSFVGNTPIKFKNIKTIPPVCSEELSKILKQYDIFIQASKTEACSNALIEGISSGLPVVAFNATSNPEVVNKGGELFNSKEDVIDKIEKVVKNYKYYQDNLPIFSIKDKAEEYYNIILGYQNINNKKINFTKKLKFLILEAIVLIHKIINKICLKKH